MQNAEIDAIMLGRSS